MDNPVSTLLFCRTRTWIKMKAAVIYILASFVSFAFPTTTPVPNFNDPLFSQQFYLNEKYGVTMNIHKAWNKGITGKNVTICIIDPTGVEKNHDDFASKFVVEGSFDLRTNSSDPSPDASRFGEGPYSHGTQMAGVALAKANNGKCVVGVAYDAKMSGIRTVMTGSVTPSEKEAILNRLGRALGHANHINDIYSCSWSPLTQFQDTVGHMKEADRQALRNSTTNGRGGKGNIYVFSAGNGAPFNGTCGYNEFVTSIHTITISVVTGKNVKSTQNVKCSAIHAVTYSRDLGLGIAYPHDIMPTCALKNTCAKTTGASSAATAVASGIFALVLQANPSIGWRDLQHLITRSSCSDFKNITWTTNKAGIKVSDDFGFGLLDADALITNAKKWKNVGKQLECAITLPSTPKPIDGIQTLNEVVDLTSWPASCGGEGQRINYVEHVVLQFSLNFTRRSDIEIAIESPGGTKSFILRSGRFWDRNKEISKLSTMSLHFWGENPRGNWQIRIRNVKPNAGKHGTLFDCKMTVYGSSSDPMAGNTVVASQIKINQTSTPSPSTTVGASSKITVVLFVFVVSLGHLI
ncbi:proprotein convertase subtilisin/kexin type 6-like isoform X2 [Rhopilema esculentum]|uniref:proprotein convertase subtilisin/kexin type 6-like isoform X2 n=1 Tax=Rhopilema esculentum TaxID=499914 RepID=UPI0031DD3FE5